MFDEGRFYSAPEVWRLSRGPRALVYADLAAGRLRAIRRGRRWLVPGAAAAAWVAEMGGGDAYESRDEGTAGPDPNAP